METTVTGVIASLRRLVEPYQFAATASLGLVLLLVASIFALGPVGQKKPPMLGETIPFFSNTIQYMADMNTFLSRTTKALRNQNIVGFRLGGKKAYFVTGAQNMQTFFRNSPSIGFETFLLYAIRFMMGATPEDVAKFANDKSGRLAAPLPGTEDTPQNQRYWAAMHSIMHKYLSQTYYANALASTYQRFFAQELDARFPVGEEWTEARIVPIMKDQMARAAILSLLGCRIFEVIPNLLDLFWDYDKVLGTILYGPPKWLFPGVYATAERCCGATAKFFQSAAGSFDWDGSEAEADWEPLFGPRFWREFSRWMVRSEFSPRTCGGFTCVTGIVAVNANTIPVCAWAVIEMIRDPSLLESLRSQVDSVAIDSSTGQRTFDLQRLINLPLLQSVYTEVMRLHVSINVTREVVQPLEVEGYMLTPGSILQAPTELAHLNESVWGAEGHPAGEFWAERNIKWVEEPETGKRVPVFEVRGRPTDWFPYGGGVAICPGRHFAKQEIMLTIAILASKFDYEFVEWVKMDGTPSDRPPRNDTKYAGAAGVPPDVDIKVRLKRRW